MISFLGDDNVAYSILGRAGVVRAPSSVHPMMNVIRVDVIDIKSDRSILCKVNKGVQWEYTSEDAKDLLDALYQEMRELARTL